MKGEWLSSAEAAALLGIRPASLRRLVAQGRLPCEPHGPRVRLFRRAEVERYARTRRPRGRPGKGASGG